MQQAISFRFTRTYFYVIPAQAGIQGGLKGWTPAFAGVTERIGWA